MSTTVSGTACPITGCDYEGSPSSVEAHISGSTDDRHQGELGRDHRHALEPPIQGEETTGEVAVDTGYADVAGDQQGKETSDAATSEEASQAGGLRVPAIPVSTPMLIGALVLVAVAVLYLNTSGGSSSGTASTEDEDEDDEQTRRRESSGGLTGRSRGR